MLGEAFEHVVREQPAALDQLGGEIVDDRQINQLGRHCGMFGKTAREDLCIDNLIHVGDAFVLGDGNRIDCMASALAAKSPDVRLQIAGEAGEVAGSGGPVAHRAAVDHRARRGGHLAQRAVEREPEAGAQ